jgi:hypothetical protein
MIIWRRVSSELNYSLNSALAFSAVIRSSLGTVQPKTLAKLGLTFATSNGVLHRFTPGGSA